jgi:hypothetical protein
LEGGQANQVRPAKDYEQREAAKSKQAVTQTKQQVFEQKMAEYSKQRPGLQEAISDPTLPISKAMFDEVLESERPAELMEYLADNPAEAARIYRLDERGTAREIAKIEGRLASPKSEAKEEAEVEVEAPPKPTSKAPAPITPVKKTAPSAVVDLNDPNVSYKDWVKAREAKLKRT